jgi:hypothetical protein
MFSYLYINKRAVSISLGVVNQDGLSFSRHFIRDINATSELQTVTRYNSFQEALNNVFKNNVNGLYYFK